MKGTFRVPERIYSAPDEFGYRQLLHGAGDEIPWATAVAEGLVAGDAVPAEAVPFIVPHNVFDEAPGGGRRLMHREGTVISLADAVRLGLVAPPADVAAEPAPDVPEPPVEAAEVEPLVTPQVGKRVRTTKLPNPKT
jgi:hypothetical protein